MTHTGSDNPKISNTTVFDKPVSICDVFKMILYCYTDTSAMISTFLIKCVRLKSLEIFQKYVLNNVISCKYQKITT